MIIQIIGLSWSVKTEPGKAAAKVSALAKLAELALTEEEAKAIAG